MGGTAAPELSHSVDGEARARERLSLVLKFAQRVRPYRPTPLLTAAVVLCVAVTLLALLTYWGARTFTSRAADDRAAEEAASFAMHSSLLATGDAFNGYLQILRYSEDPIVRARDASVAARGDAMQQLLWLNTNKMDSLAIVDRSGLVLQATDASIRNVRTSSAFSESRANLGPANSDIVLPEAGERGYVEYSAPLRDADGSVWGFLYARAEPQVLWRDTLNATIDGGHNVVINSEGLFSAGVPDALLKQPWRGSPLENGSVRTDIAGVASICGLGAIGKDTQIDHGWFVASCLPASLIQVEAGRALGNQGQITIAGAVLVIVLSIGLLRIVLGGSPMPAGRQTEDEEEAAVESEQPLASQVMEPPHDNAEAFAEPVMAATQSEAASDGPESREPAPAPPIVVVADVDALNLIEAYERRNAELANELRETIQARLMIATARVEEAFRLIDTDPDRAASLHQGAVVELAAIRERELRTIGQELHPGIVRLGLPAALRTLRKELEGGVAIELTIGANVDGASSRGGRVTIDPRLRLIVYRVIRDAVRAAADAGAKQAKIEVQRHGLELRVTVEAELPHGSEPYVAPLAALAIALEAFAGHLTVESGQHLAIAAHVIAPHVEQPEAELPREEGASEDDAQAVAAELPELSTMLEDAPALIPTHAPFVPAGPGAHTFELADGEPGVIDASPEHQTPMMPSTATTFRLPDDEPKVVPADGEAGADAAPHDEEELPKVVQVASLTEVAELQVIDSSETDPATGDQSSEASNLETEDVPPQGDAESAA